VGIRLDENFLLGKTKRNNLVPNGGTILQEERELRAEWFMVDIAQVSESCAFELKTFNIVHCKPTAINFLYAILNDQVLKGLVDVTTRV
jgi:hypothetical protein